MSAEPTAESPPVRWQDVPMPPQIQVLPKDKRGFPILFSIQQPDGSHDFRGISPRQVIKCATGRLCGVCGQRLPYWIWFVGGPLAVKNRVFGDPPMHEDCLRYALVVCPYLAHRDFDRLPKDDRFEAQPGAIIAKPDQIILYKTRHYTLKVVTRRGGVLFFAAAPIHVETIQIRPEAEERGAAP